MIRIIIGLAFIPFYLGWLVYRLFIKHDLAQHKNDFYGLTFFIVVWIVIFGAIMWNGGKLSGIVDFFTG